LNVQSALPQFIRPVFAFDSLLGYSDSGTLSLNEFRDSVIGNYKSMNRILRKLYRLDYDLINFTAGILPGSLVSMDANIRFSICFIDVQSGHLTVELLEWAMINVEVGGIIVIEGVNSPFFPDVATMLAEYDIPSQFREIKIDWDYTLVLENSVLNHI
jgi:hypothetical protein